MCAKYLLGGDFLWGWGFERVSVEGDKSSAMLILRKRTKRVAERSLRNMIDAQQTRQLIVDVGTTVQIDFNLIPGPVWFFTSDTRRLMDVVWSRKAEMRGDIDLWRCLFISWVTL